MWIHWGVSELYNDVLKDFLKKAFEKGLIEAVIAPAATDNSYTYALITKKEDVDKLTPIAPVMQWNGADMIGRITRLKPVKRKTLAILRPCETRTYKELIKFNQINSENFYILTYDCPGTIHARNYVYDQTPVDNLIKSMKEGKISEKVRESCRVCEYPTPIKGVGDIGFGIIGVDEPVFFSLSERGKDFLAKMEIQEGERDDSSWVEMHRKNREKWLEEERITGGRKGIEKFLAQCMNCHNCKDMCPICFCKECFFEDHSVFDYESEKFYNWADDKNGIRLPTDKTLFHIGRLIHMGTSCIGCGLCQQACPVDIPLYRLFGIVGNDLQKVFDYKPGVNDDIPPVMDFREDELHEFEGLKGGEE